MNKQKVYIVSPREPNGVSWLINCFLELGILTYNGRSWRNTWRRTNDGYSLVPWQTWTKMILPSLSVHERFRFDPGLEASWSHSWPGKLTAGAKIIYFDRDPADALYSLYKREAPAANFRAFVEALNYETLLDAAETNALFARTWLSDSRTRRFCFEDYKTDPERTLSSVLAYVGVDASASKIAAATAASTSQKTAEAERIWKQSASAVERYSPRVLRVAMNQGGILGRAQEIAARESGTLERIRGLRDQLDGPTLSGYLAFVRKHNRLITSVASSKPERADCTVTELLQRRALTIARSIDVARLRDLYFDDNAVRLLLIGLGCLALRRDPVALAAVELAYRGAFGLRADFYASIFRRSGRLAAVATCPDIVPHLAIDNLARIKRRVARFARVGGMTQGRGDVDNGPVRCWEE